MTPHNTNIIFGPPGTGKTTRLLNIVNDLLSTGTKPNEVCFLAFTRKAANEARDRAVLKFGLRYEDFPLFRTIHSLAFKTLALTRTDVMGYRDYVAIATSLSLHITFQNVAEDGTIPCNSRGDRLLFMESMARARMMDLEDYWRLYPNEDIPYWELRQLADTIDAYKKSTFKLDFIDMLYRFLAEGRVPEHRHLIIDEAQDLSPLQWNVIKKLSKESLSVTIAGDDDQAIFTWAGADVDEFINLPGSRTVLAKSYRVPAEIQRLANTIVSRVETRVSKGWEPRNALGTVDYVSDLSQVDLSQGTWLLLARNRFLLQQYNDHLVSMGHVFTSLLGSPTEGATLEAIVSWENLRKGLAIPVSEALKVYDLMSAKVGVAHGFKKRLEEQLDNTFVSMQHLRDSFGLLTDKIWHEALDRIPDVDREYFLSALRKGEKLLKEPRIRVSTIHSVKGGEADNVLLCTDMAARTYGEMYQNPDNEHRVWYVAVTRAKERLVIMQPRTSTHYQL